MLIYKSPSKWFSRGVIIVTSRSSFLGFIPLTIFFCVHSTKRFDFKCEPQIIKKRVLSISSHCGDDRKLHDNYLISSSSSSRFVVFIYLCG